jgi:hypothetical protein
MYEDWSTEPKSEMLRCVLVAVDGARTKVIEAGEDLYVTYVEQVHLEVHPLDLVVDPVHHRSALE